MQEMDEAVEKEEEALQALRAESNVVSSESESLNRDAHMWKSQIDAAKASRASIEKDFKEARQDFSTEKLKLQAGIERLATLTASTQEEFQRTGDHIEEFRRIATTRETEQVTRTGAAESLVRDMQEEMALLKKRFLDAADARTRTETEVATARQRLQEFQASLEQDFENKKQALAEERQRLSDQCCIESRASDQAKDQLGREKGNSVAMLRRVQEESRNKLNNAELQRVRVEETCREERTGAMESVTQQQKFTDTLEHDLHRLRYLLTESEANLGWVRQELEREEREAGHSLQQLQHEAQRASIELEKAVNNEGILIRQIEETTVRNQQELTRLTKELEAIRRATATEQAESEVKIQRARADFEFDVHHTEDRHRSTLHAEKLQEEAFERENSQLRSFLAEQSATSGGLSQLHNKLETHIQRLQRHTEDLRRDIHSSAVAPPVGVHAATDYYQRSPRRSPSPTQDIGAHVFSSPKLAGSSFALGGNTSAIGASF
jgi:chromosome segregation ATPase